MVEGALDGGSWAAVVSTGSPCLLYTTTPPGLAPQDLDLVTLDRVVPGGPGLLAREADLDTSGLGRVELRDLEAADLDLGRVRGGPEGSSLMTGDSA